MEEKVINKIALELSLSENMRREAVIDYLRYLSYEGDKLAVNELNRRFEILFDFLEDEYQFVLDSTSEQSITDSSECFEEVSKFRCSISTYHINLILFPSYLKKVSMNPERVFNNCQKTEKLINEIEKQRIKMKKERRDNFE